MHKWVSQQKCELALNGLHFAMPGTSLKGFPGGSDGKESAYNAGEWNLTSGSGRSPGGGHGNPLQYSCLDIPMDRGAWQAIVPGVAKSSIQLSIHTLITAKFNLFFFFCFFTFIF